MRHQGGLVGAAMNAELDHHLGYEKNEKRLSGIDNARNGRSSKTVKGDVLSCIIKEIGDSKKCDSYMVDYQDKCTFRSSMLIYSFSDHKKAQIDLDGKVNYR